MAAFLTVTGAAFFGNAEKASLTAQPANNSPSAFPMAFLVGLVAAYGGSNLPARDVGKYGAFNLGGTTLSEQCPARFGPRLAFFAHAQIVRSNSGSGLNGTPLTWPYGNHST